ncbi:site-specific integrase [Oscillospiraceae bacterium OttesenSCG-928-F05]|nr:site-specific integrase [Oscillospiraceae bacterium OttesenSCG-928-F05]
MASIVQREKSYCVVYGYTAEDGRRKQKWETYYSEKEAIERKLELENPNAFITSNPKIRTLNDLLDYYINIYGAVRWSVNTYTDHVGKLRNYIRPHIGDVSLRCINKKFMSAYFQKLLTIPRVANKYRPSDIKTVGLPTAEKVYAILKSAFQQAVHWGMIEDNPVSRISLPQPYRGPKRMLTADQVYAVISEAMRQEQDILALLIQFAFACSMRLGEILGLCWSEVNLEEGYLEVKQELSRVNLEALESLNHKHVFHVFEPHWSHSKSRLVLKEPKTNSSKRMIYLPQTLIQYLKGWKGKQQMQNNLVDFDLVIAKEDGRPFCPRKATDLFVKAVAELGLSRVHFHSLRYSSTSYKLMLSQGDIKAVQGDTGHAQPNMVLSVYAQIQDARRMLLAETLDGGFFSKKPENKGAC